MSQKKNKTKERKKERKNNITMKKQRKKICPFLIRFKYYWGLTSEVSGDFLTLKIKAGHGQGHLVMLTIQYDILMFAIASTAIASRAGFTNLISSPIFNLVYTVVCLHESNY